MIRGAAAMVLVLSTMLAFGCAPVATPAQSGSPPVAGPSSPPPPATAPPTAEPSASPSPTPAPTPAPPTATPRPVDTTAPLLRSVVVPERTTAQTILVTATATDDVGVTEMRLANEDGSWLPWRPYAPQVEHTLSPGYGTKGVFVQVRDAAGNESQSAFRPLEYAPSATPTPADTTAPVLESVVVPETTTTQDITVTTSATDDRAVTEMRLANEDGNWLDWRPYATEVQHTLSPGYGDKGVFVQVRDAAGNESPSAFKRLRFVPPPTPPPDTTPPVLQSVSIPKTTTSRTITVTTTATDDVGVTEMRLANEDGVWLPWQPYATQVRHTLSAGYGDKGVFVQVRDAAGNESNAIFARTRYQRQ